MFTTYPLELMALNGRHTMTDDYREVTIEITDKKVTWSNTKLQI